MRVLLWLGLLILLAVGTIWLAGESWLARQAVIQAEMRPGLGLADARPLRDPRRIGVTLREPEWREGDLALAMPRLDLWLSPLRPSELRATLPSEASLTVDGRQHPVTLADGSLALAVSALHGGAISRASARGRMMTLDGEPLAEALSAEAGIIGLGHDAPPEARAAYDLALSLTGMRPDALTGLGVPPVTMQGAVSVVGPLRLWLGDALDVGVLSGARPAPRLVGLRSEGIDVTIGSARARLAGIVRAGADGRAEGRLGIYSRDSNAWLQAAAEAGMIPADGAMLASALLSGLGRLSFPEGDGDDGLALPEAGPDELRLPVILRGGRLLLGNIDLGAAPDFGWLP